MDTELTMTRFSNPKTLMRFIKDDRALVGVPTPMGMQTLMTDTQRYYLDLDKQIICLDYQLKTPDGERLFADYQMEISWVVKNVKFFSKKLEDFLCEKREILIQ